MSSDDNYTRPSKKITNEQVIEAFSLTGARHDDEAERLLDVIAKLQDLKPNQKIRTGRQLSREDVSLIVTVNGQTGVLTDILPAGERQNYPVPSMVVNGRMYEIKPYEFYILTYPEG